MTWRWQLLDADSGLWPTELSSEQSFPSQSDAESWLGESWRQLRAAGVAAVVLLEHERQVYGPMALTVSGSAGVRVDVPNSSESRESR